MQGTLLNTVTFSEMTDLVRKEFVQTQQMVQPQAAQLFIKYPIMKGQGASKRFDEVDTQTFARRKREGDAAKKASVGVGYNKTMYKKRIATEIDITQEMRDENRYPEVGDLITGLAHFCPQRIELDMNHIFTFATSSSYTDMDGDTVDVTTGDSNPLVYASHTIKYGSASTATTFRNRVSGDPVFSQGGLEAAESLTVTDVYSNFGERRVLNFNTIITGDDPNTCNAVKKVIESLGDVDASHGNVKNVYNGKYRHVKLPYLATTATGANDSTKRRWWFLAATGQGLRGWQAIYGEWEAPHMKPVKEGGSNEDYSRDIWTYGVRAGYGLIAVSGRGIIGSCPTS